MAWQKRVLVGAGLLVGLLVVPYVIGDRLVDAHGAHWWTNLVKNGPVILAMTLAITRVRRTQAPSVAGVEDPQ